MTIASIARPGRRGRRGRRSIVDDGVEDRVQEQTGRRSFPSRTGASTSELRQRSLVHRDDRVALDEDGWSSRFRITIGTRLLERVDDDACSGVVLVDLGPGAWVLRVSTERMQLELGRGLLEILALGSEISSQHGCSPRSSESWSGGWSTTCEASLTRRRRCMDRG